MERPRTKLVCTIGPASLGHVRELVDLGMSVARVNFSHGTRAEHREAVHAVRAAAHHARRSVAVLVDLPGLKIRLGDVAGGEVRLDAGATFELRPGGDEAPAAEAAAEGSAAADELAAQGSAGVGAPAAEGAAAEEGPAAAEGSDAERPVNADASSAAEGSAARPAEGSAAGASVNHARLAELLRVGDRVLLADGAVELVVSAVIGGTVATEVVRGGLVRSRAGVSVPSARLTGPSLTPGDEEGLARALELRCDMIGQSFVRSADDVRELRRRLPSDGPLIVAKIETQSAVADFDAIAEVADGVMVARGDLGVDLPFADVPLIQKDLIRRARRLGRFTIVATQMLESMTAAPRPTRAEASDVANAVLDGADALMLSGETAIGTYPVAAAQAMLDIVSATERDHSPAGATPETVDAAARTGIGEAQRAVVAGAASMLAANTAIAAAWCFTRTGRTAQLLADQHPRQPVVAFTISPIVARRLAVRRGVLPIVLSGTRAGEPLIAQMAAAARAHGALGKPTEAALVLLVTTSTAPDGINRLELQRV